MTREEELNFLRGYRRASNEIRCAEHKIQALKEQIESLRESQMSVSAVATEGMPKGSGVRDALADYVTILDGLERELRQKIEEYRQLSITQRTEQKKIETAIDLIEDPVSRDVLWMRFIREWRIARISDAIGYSESHTYRLCKTAVEKMVVNEK